MLETVEKRYRGNQQKLKHETRIVKTHTPVYRRQAMFFDDGLDDRKHHSAIKKKRAPIEVTADELRSQVQACMTKTTKWETIVADEVLNSEFFFQTHATNTNTNTNTKQTHTTSAHLGRKGSD